MTDIQRVKEAIRLESYIPGLKKAGRLFKMCCPFHNEKTPSFVVTPETQQWRCYGSCGTGGDVYAFVMQRDHCTFGEALKTVAADAHITLTPRTRTALKEDAQSARTEALLKTVADLYHAFLLGDEGRSAYRYLTERGLTADTIVQWQIGLAPASWDWLTGRLLMRGYTAKELLALGLAKDNDKGGVYDAFRGRIIFPIRDERGHIVGFGGRALGRDDGLAPKYINSTQSDAFNKSSLLYGLHRARTGIRQTGRAVIVEGYMDVLTAHQAGFTNVVAQMGTALTPSQRDLLRSYTPTLVLALDGDAAGQSATQRAAETHIASGMDLRVFALPTGMDPDDLIRAKSQLWESGVNEAPSLVDVFIAQRVASLSQDANVLQKQTLQRDLTPHLTVKHNPEYTQENLTKLAQALDLMVRPALVVLPPAPKPASQPSPLEMAVLHNLIVNDDDRWFERINVLLSHVCSDAPYALATLRSIDFPNPLAARMMGLIWAAVSARVRPVHEYVEDQIEGTDLKHLYMQILELPAVQGVSRAEALTMPRHDNYQMFVEWVFRLRLIRLREDMRVLSGLGDEASIARWSECSRGVSYLMAGLRGEAVKHG